MYISFKMNSYHMNQNQSITRSNNAWHRLESLYKINFINDQFRLDEWHAQWYILQFLKLYFRKLEISITIC